MTNDRVDAIDLARPFPPKQVLVRDAELAGHLHRMVGRLALLPLTTTFRRLALKANR